MPRQSQSLGEIALPFRADACQLFRKPAKELFFRPYSKEIYARYFQWCTLLLQILQGLLDQGSLAGLGSLVQNDITAARKQVCECCAILPATDEMLSRYVGAILERLIHGRKYQLLKTDGLEEVVTLVVNEDECREVLDLDLPDCLHSKLRVLYALDALDVVLGENCSRATD